MTGESDLRKLFADMNPSLDELPYVFCTMTPEIVSGLPFLPLGTFQETEGVTVIATERQAKESRLPFDSLWARITLTVHSSLLAVGFLAVLLDGMAKAGISVNPVSAYYHDHLFVPWEARGKAMDVLARVSNGRVFK
jgi:hypothetical protein